MNKIMRQEIREDSKQDSYEARVKSYPFPIS